MRFAKAVKVISLISFLLLLCPSNLYYSLFFAAVAITFTVVTVNKTNFLKVTVSTTASLVSLIINLLLSLIFLHRWGALIGNTPALFLGIALSFLGITALPRLVFSFNTKEISYDTSKSNKLSIPEILICFLGSFVILLIATRSTPLIPYNDYCDANVMFTIGRGVLYGKVPYRDLIDHKGPVILFLHTIGALITRNSFTGVWVLEWLSCFASMILGFKIHKLIVPDADIISKILVVPLTTLSYFTLAFLYGDNAESFSVPIVLFGLYIGIKTILSGKVKFIETYLIGIGIGLIFWTKFTLCGSFVGMFIVYVVYAVKKKEIKKLFITVLSLAAGLLTVSLILFGYFMAHGALGDLIQVYIFNNIFNYNLGNGQMDAINSFIMPVNMLGYHLGKNYGLFILSISGLIYLFKKNKAIFAYVFTSFITCSIFAFIGSKSYTYYSFILTAFATVGWSALISLIKFIVNNIKVKAPKLVWVLPAAILFCISAISECPNWEILFLTLEQSPVYGCSQYIQQSPNPTLLCYGFQDRGFYTYNNITPDVPYFTYMNMNGEYIKEQQRKYVEEGNYEFIITEVEPYDFEGYELIFTDPNLGEGLTYYLYRRVS